MTGGSGPWNRHHILFWLSFGFVGLLIIEGGASFLYVTKNWGVPRLRATFSPSYAEFDTELGWINKRDLYLKDYYGAGHSIRTNHSGFRNERDYPNRRGRGIFRILCSGDSFTFGTGVDTSEAWCNRLESESPSWEALNLGVGAYDIVQAYRLYIREARHIEHDLHLFAFILDDFDRMQRELGRPLLTIKKGKVVLPPEPATEISSAWERAIGLASVFENLNFVKIIEMGYEKFFLSDQPDLDPVGLFRAIVQDLKRRSESGPPTVLVYLPTRQDIGTYRASTLSHYLEELGNEMRVPVIDLSTDFLAVPYAKRLKLFGGFFAHYSLEGNAFVEKRIVTHLKALVPIGLSR